MSGQYKTSSIGQILSKKTVSTICIPVFTLIISVMTTYLEGMDSTAIIVIPGMHNCGGTNVKQLFPEITTVIRTEVPTQEKNDLGQRNCIGLLKKSIHEALQTPGKTITSLMLYGVGQGGATAINYLSLERNNRKVMDQIKCLILESPLLSANNTIIKTAKSGSRLYSFPFNWVIIPYFVSCTKFPCYSPKGYQASRECKNLRQALPVIIIDNTNSSLIEANQGACLYAGLRRRQQCFIYKIIVNREADTTLLKPEDKETTGLRAIVEKHINVQSKTDETKLLQYQPAPSCIEIRSFYTIARTDRTINCIGLYLPISTFITILWIVNNCFNY